MSFHDVLLHACTIAILPIAIVLLAQSASNAIAAFGEQLTGGDAFERHEDMPASKQESINF